MLRNFLIILIKLYQYCISPFMKAHCRYIPSCSEYSIEAIRRYGAIRGGVLGIKRIMKCNPFGSYGFDPV